MPFTPDPGSIIQVTTSAPTVTLNISLPESPQSCMLTSIEVSVNPGESYAWTGTAPTGGGNFTAYGFLATNGSPGTLNNVLITYKYMRMPGMNPVDVQDGHTFYLYM